jgi:NAD(P)H-nitrite reductase large subunit
MHFVIVGNGVCGMEAALALRAREADARITLVSDEHDHFFSRPALMYVFAGQTRLQDTEPYDRHLYERMRFERVRGRVATLDAAGHALALDDGRRVSYDKLLLAVGSKARAAPWPGAEGTGLHYFVTLRDLEGLDRDARKGGRAVVIGGGLIGVEVAEILHDRGLHVTFLIRENWYFPMALDGNESALVAQHTRAHGVDVRLGIDVEALQRGPDGRPRAVRVDGNELPADLVAASIGVVPHTAFVAGGSVALSKGGAIEVDDALRTGTPDVWAAALGGI